MKPPPPPPKVVSLTSISFQLTIDASEKARKTIPPERAGPSGQIGRIRRWGEVARLEVGMGAAEPHALVLTPDALIQLDPQRRMAVRRTMTAAQRQALFRRGSAFGLIWEIEPAQLWPGAKVVGQEKVRGTVCDLWELKEKGPLGGVYRAWLPKGRKKALPLRLRADTAIPIIGAPPERSIRTVDALRVTQARATVDPQEYSIPRGYALREDRNAGLGLSGSAQVVQPK